MHDAADDAGVPHQRLTDQAWPDNLQRERHPEEGEGAKYTDALEAGKPLARWPFSLSDSLWKETTGFDPGTKTGERSGRNKAEQGMVGWSPETRTAAGILRCCIYDEV
ncbi:hypothetical protein N9L68_00485 [bacterium]|nr:hypothetical protein [bacterium]